MKQFLVYTGLRLLLFAASLALVFGVWLAIADQVSLTGGFVLALVALALSGVGSYFLLRPQREAFARVVDARAHRASQAFEEMRSKEDVD